MKRACLMIVLGIIVYGTACRPEAAGPSGPQAQPPPAKAPDAAPARPPAPAQPTPQAAAPAQPAEPAPPVVAGLDDPVARLNELLPGMGAEQIVAREKAQQELERLCLALGAPGHARGRAALCLAMGAQLKPSTPKPVRVWLLRQLERIGGAEAVPAITQVLADPDPELADLARRALQATPGLAAGTALREALAQAETAEWQIALLNALAARHDHPNDLVELVRPLVLTGEDHVALAAIAALGDAGGYDSAYFLNVFLRDDPARVRAVVGQPGESHIDLRPRVIESLLRIATRLEAAGRADQGADLCEKVWLTLRPDDAVHLRLAVLRGRVAVRGVELLGELMAVLADETADPVYRAEVATLAGGLPGFPVTMTLAGALPGAQPDTQVLLITALTQREAPEAEPALVGLLESPAEPVRIAVLEALGRVGHESVAVPLAKAAARARGPEREAARRSLARLRGGDVDRVLLEALDAGGEPSVQVELITALTTRACRQALPSFFTRAGDRDETVRVAALRGLGALGRQSDAPDAVQLLLAADSEGVQQAAEEAVTAICNRTEPAEQRAGPVLAAWAAARPDARVALLRVLGRVGGPAALEKIRAAARGEDAGQVDAAVRALAAWPGNEVLADLLAIATDSSNKTQRVLALQGYIRLLGAPSERSDAETLALYRGALQLAERPEEQKAVLAGLQNVRHLEALALAESLLENEALRAEAEAAVEYTAYRLSPLEPARATAAVQRILAETKVDANRERATRILENIRRSQGCLVLWRYSGPYAQDGLQLAGLVDHAFAPEQSAATPQWRPLALPRQGEPWVFDLTTLDEDPNRCVYVQTAIWSPHEQAARLEVGSDDAVKAWLNGVAVHEHRAVRPHSPLEDKAAVKLRRGWNTLMLKVVQGDGGWGFSAAVRDPDGQPLEGLRYAAEAGER